MQACLKKDIDTKPESLASNLKLATSEATELDLVMDSGSADDIVENKKWFKSLGELDTTVTNQLGANTKDLGRGEVEVSAKHRRMHQVYNFEKTLYVPRYRIKTISVSSVIDNGHKVVHEKKNNFHGMKNNKKILKTRERELFFSRTTPKN